MRFVDTNVLIYAASPAPNEADKQNAAQRLLEAGDLALSVQVLQEFYHQATRSTRLGTISQDHALRFIESISHFSGARRHPRGVSRRRCYQPALSAVILGRRDPRGGACPGLRRRLFRGPEPATGLRRPPGHKPVSGRISSVMPTDTSERGLERLICTALAGHPCEPPAAGTVAEPPAGYGGVGWSGGNFHDYDREYCVDLVQPLGHFCVRPNPKPRNRWDYPRTARRGANSWPGFRAGYPSAAASTCCATASTTGHTTWTCSTARLQPETRRPRSASSRTASPLPGSCATAATKPSGRWTSGCSSTACRSSPLNSRTA